MTAMCRAVGLSVFMTGGLLLSTLVRINRRSSGKEPGGEVGGGFGFGGGS